MSWPDHTAVCAKLSATPLIQPFASLSCAPEAGPTHLCPALTLGLLAISSISSSLKYEG